MNTMVDQPSLSSVQKAIEAHLAPSVHLQSLPRALELLAHIALIANKLSDEITRILESNSCHHSGSDHLRLSDKVVERVRSCRADAEKASKRLWQFSVDLRLNVSLEWPFHRGDQADDFSISPPYYLLGRRCLSRSCT